MKVCVECRCSRCIGKPGKSKISKRKIHKSVPVIFQYFESDYGVEVHNNRSQQLHQRTATYSTRSSSLHCLPFRTRQLCLHAELLTTQRRQHGTVFLPADILTCDSESGFKRLLKTHLFNNCLNVALLTHSQRLCSSAHGALHICL